jgi:hypothetical protein
LQKNTRERTYLAEEDKGDEGRYIAQERLANNDKERLPGCSESLKAISGGKSL